MATDYHRNLVDSDDSEHHSIGHDPITDYTIPSLSKPVVAVKTKEQIDDERQQSLTDRNEYDNNNDRSINQQSSIQNNNVRSKPSTPYTPPYLSRTSSFSSVGSVFALVGAKVGDKIKAGSIKGSIFTMCISIVGAGSLALPYALRNAGLIVGVSLIFFGALLAYFTLDLLLISAEHLPEALRGPKPYRDISYQTLARHSYGPRLSRALQVLMAVQYFGSMIAYVVAFSGLIDLVWSIFNDTSIYTYCVIGICYGIIFPLSLLRSISSLRFTSLLGFSCSVYLVIVVVIEYFVLCHESDDITSTIHNHYKSTCFYSKQWDISSDELFPFTTFEKLYQGFLTAFPLVIFSYTGHPFLLPLYVELARPSKRRMRKVFRRGLSIINILYIFIGLFGYLLFLQSVCGNLLLNDFRKHADVIIAALGISISCILTEPIFAYNFRRMIGHLFWNQKTSQLSTTKHVVITFIFVSANVLLGIFVKSISIVFGFLGSTTYPILGYILPAAFFLKLVPKGQYKIRKIIAVIQATFVAIVSICSLIYKFTSPGDLDCDNAQSIG